jgi:Fe2+ transport system protein FeoA
MTRRLWDLRAGESARLAAFDEALDPRYRTRLTELGFQPGAVVECMRRPAFGAPRVFRVRGAVFSLEDVLARRVFVEPEEAAASA